MKRKAFTIISLILVIFMVVSLFGCSVLKEVQSDNNQATEKQQDETNAETEAPVKKVYNIGETYNEDGVKVTLVSCDEEIYEKYDGKKINLLKIFVKVENDSNDSVSIMQSNFDCYVNNKATEFSYYGKEEGLGIEGLSPGRYKEGYLYVEATKKDNVELEFAISWYPSEDEKIIFKIA